jgi:membrane protein involved in colicin uptake
MPRVPVLILPALALLACTDKAEPDFNQCIEHEEKADLWRAIESCEAAVKADAKSRSGKAAAEKLSGLKSAKDKQLREEQAARDAASAASEAEKQKAQRTAFDNVKKEIEFKPPSMNSSVRDGNMAKCAKMGKPYAHGCSHVDGSKTGNEECAVVAEYLGCVQDVGRFYCCPKEVRVNVPGHGRVE